MMKKISVERMLNHCMSFEKERKVSRMKEMIATGASISAHCRPCLTYRHAKAREMGIDDTTVRDMRNFVESLVRADIIELGCNCDDCRSAQNTCCR